MWFISDVSMVRNRRCEKQNASIFGCTKSFQITPDLKLLNLTHTHTYIYILYIYIYYVVYIYISFIEGSLEVKLPTIWTDEKQSREEAERRERLEERRVEEKE